MLNLREVFELSRGSRIICQDRYPDISVCGVRELLGTFEPINKIKPGKVDYGSSVENLYLEISYNTMFFFNNDSNTF